MVREPFLEGIILPLRPQQQLPYKGLPPRLAARLLTAIVLLLLSCSSCIFGAQAVAVAATTPAASCQEMHSSQLEELQETAPQICSPVARWLFMPPAARMGGPYTCVARSLETAGMALREGCLPSRPIGPPPHSPGQSRKYGAA